MEYDLNHDTFLYFTMSDTPGTLYDLIKSYQEKYDYHHDKKIADNRSFAICKGIIPDALAVQAFRSALVGDVMRHVKITIEEITWIK